MTAQQAAQKAKREAAKRAEELAAQRAEEDRRREEFARSPQGIAQARQEAQDAQRDRMALMMRYTYQARSEQQLMTRALSSLDDNGEADDADTLGFTGADLAATLVDGRISHAGLVMLAACQVLDQVAAELSVTGNQLRRRGGLLNQLAARANAGRNVDGGALATAEAGHDDLVAKFEHIAALLAGVATWRN